MLKRAAKAKEVLKRLRVIIMDLSKVNVAANISFIPTKKLKDLSIDQAYTISKFREAQTQFGKRIVVELNNEFAVFLPVRMVKLFEEDEKLYDEMKKAAEDGHLGMQYMGGKYNKIEFKNL